LHESHHLDVVIIGDGFVGLSVAIALSKLPLTIGIVGLSVTSSFSDLRAIALTARSQRLLYQWMTLKQWMQPIQCVHVSVKGCWHKLRFDAKKIGVDALGYVITGQQLRDNLRHFIKQLPSTTCYQTHFNHDALCHHQRSMMIRNDHQS